MIFTIDNGTKQVIIKSAKLTDLDKIKEAIQALGGNPNEYNIVSDTLYYTYPSIGLPQITYGYPLYNQPITF